MTLDQNCFGVTPEARQYRGPHLPGTPCNHSDSVQFSSNRVPMPRTIFGRSWSYLQDAEQRLHEDIHFSFPRDGLHGRCEGTETPHPHEVKGPRRGPGVIRKLLSRSSERATSISLDKCETFGKNGDEHQSKNGSAAQPSREGTNMPTRDFQADTISNTGSPAGRDSASQRISRDVEQAIPKNNTEEPQNGRTAWLHALTGFLVVANCWGIGNAWGLFQAYYEIVYLQGTPPSSIAWIGSTQLALVFGLGFPVGKLVDKGYFHTVFHVGSFLMVLGIFCTAWCKSLATLWLTQGLITGIGMGCLFCSGVTAMMTWFDETHVSIAMGFAAAGSCVGGIVYIVLVRHLLVHQGFQTTMIVIGAVAAVSMIPANIVFRLRVDKQHKHTLLKRPYEPAYFLAAAGMFFAFMGVYFGFVYMVLYSSTVLHLSNKAATDLLIFMLSANLPGRFIPGIISDKFMGPLTTIVPCALLSSAVLWAWAAAETNRTSLTVIACVYGFLTAGVQVLYISLVYTFCSDPEDKNKLRLGQIGIRAGGLYTAIGLACLIGTPIGGALISYRTDRGMARPYLGAQTFAALSLLVGGLFFLASRIAMFGLKRERV